jgi:hypothetical protein
MVHVISRELTEIPKRYLNSDLYIKDGLVVKAITRGAKDNAAAYEA